MKNYLVIILLFSSSLVYAQTNISMTQTFQQYISEGITSRDVTKSSRSMVSFNQKQETEGSAYLLNNWSKGSVFLKNKATLSEPSDVLNFDKTKNILIMKISADEVLEVDMAKIEGFTLEDNGHKYTLLHLLENDPSYFLEVYKDSAFSLYKSLNTKFYKSDYVNKGLYETGYKYDRYVDENGYFIKDKNGNVSRFKDVNKSEINDFANEHPVVKEFMKKNKLPKQDENKDSFMTNLTIVLNKS